jgi:hypothetical protein
LEYVEEGRKEDDIIMNECVADRREKEEYNMDKGMKQEMCDYKKQEEQEEKFQPMNDENEKEGMR